MKKLISDFPKQIDEAIIIGNKITSISKAKSIQHVVVSGLGGSGIGASIVADYCFNLLNIPFLVNKNYFIPKFINNNTLFIACSYSGDTEETLQAVELAKKNKAQIYCITSGGTLAIFAKKNKIPCILIPSGMPPRACLGYSMIQILYILNKSGLIKNNFEKEVINGNLIIKKEKMEIQKIAKKISKKLIQNQIAIYITEGYVGLAVRFRQQLNENSKSISWHNVIPEMTHNEIVGWSERHKNLSVIFCQCKDDYQKNNKRMLYTKNVIKKYAVNCSDIIMKGNTYWEKALYFIHLTDWISVYLADYKKQDVTEVKVITGLKKIMANK